MSCHRYIIIVTPREGSPEPQCVVIRNTFDTAVDACCELISGHTNIDGDTCREELTKNHGGAVEHLSFAIVQETFL
jgi:hypothetical protein